MTKPDWENFAKAVLSDWPTGDLDGSVLFDLSLQYGMIQEVPGGYNPHHHIDADGICPEEGDPWYEYTFRGEAGPGLCSITTLTEQLEAARRDATEAEAYAAELEARLATCEKYRDAYAECDRIATQAVRDLEARLEKAVNMLSKHCDPMDMSDEDEATLAELKGRPE